MQEYIDKNRDKYIHIFFGSEEESKQFTYDELFNPKKERQNNDYIRSTRVQKLSRGRSLRD